MKKIIIFAICTFILISAVGCSASDKKHGYLALGDSITTGYEPDGSHLTDDSFAGIIASNFGTQCDNYAKDGSTSAELLQLVTGGSADDKIENAGLVTITTGGNDMLYFLYSKITDAYNALYQTQKTSDELMAILSGNDIVAKIPVAAVAESVFAALPSDADAQTAVEQYAQNVKSTAKYIKSKNPNAIVAVATQYNPFENLANSSLSFYKSLYACTEFYVSLMREKLISAADEGNFRIADVYSEFSKKQGLCNANEQNLDVHPNNEGHKLIAKVFENALEPKVSAVYDGEKVTALRILSPVFDENARVITLGYTVDGNLNFLRYFSATGDKTVPIDLDGNLRMIMIGKNGSVLCEK